MDKIVGQVRKCIEDYGMIRDGDRIAVGVSGGKDSLMLLAALAELRRYYPKSFELAAVTLDMGFPDMDFAGVDRFCKNLGVEWTLVKTDIKTIVFDLRREANPCSLCAKMRRGALHGAIRERGMNKIALGHHFDDAVETFFLSLIYEGRISCFEPVTYMRRAGLTQIRPLLYVGEGTVRNAARRLGLPVVPSTCPHDGASKREEVKEMIAGLRTRYPDLKDKVFGAMQRYPLRGWETGLEEHLENEQQPDAGQAENAHHNGIEPVDAQGDADKAAKKIEDKQEEKTAYGVEEQLEEQPHWPSENGDAEQ